jgi:hypothetical protein
MPIHWTGPPVRKRERRPAYNGAAHLESISNGYSNATSYNRSRSGLQAARYREIRQPRRQRFAERVGRLGDHALFELLDQIAVRFGIKDEIDRLLRRFARLDPDTLHALGACRLTAASIHSVEDGR